MIVDPVSKQKARGWRNVYATAHQMRQRALLEPAGDPGYRSGGIVSRQAGLSTRRPTSEDTSVGRSSCFVKEGPGPAVSRADPRAATHRPVHRSWPGAVGVLLFTRLVIGAVTDPPGTSPTTAPSEAVAPSPAAGPPPVVDDGTELPLPAAGSATADPSLPLFAPEPSNEPDPALEAARQREAAVLETQNTLALNDPLARAAFPRAETNAESVFNGIGGVPRGLNPLFAAPGVAGSQGFRLGPLTIHPVLSAGINYESTTGGRSQATSGFYGTISPAFTLTLGEPATGRSVNMVYTGSLSFGSSVAAREAYEQSLAVNGTLNFTKLNLGAGLSYSQLSGADRDAGGQDVNRDLVSLSLNGSYAYSEKTSLTTTLSVPVRLFGQGTSSEGVNSTSFVNYAYSPLTTVGVGFGLGTLQVEGERAQVFEQALGRLSYSLTQKVSFSGTVGYEFRDAGSREEITPVFSLGANWAIREGTALALSAQRTIVNSAAQAGTNYTDTSLTASIAQRLGSSVQFSGTVGYENASYTGVESGVSSNRNDNELILQGALSTHIKDHWALTGTLSYAKNFSNEDAFRTVQTSLQLSYVY